MQRDDFVELFRIMDGLPVTIRLLDPPLHEFLPKTDARDGGGRGGDRQGYRRDPRTARAALHEANPMLGHRGCRLGITASRDLRDAGARDLRGGGGGR